jgi:hypothetical protein
MGATGDWGGVELLKEIRDIHLSFEKNDVSLDFHQQCRLNKNVILRYLTKTHRQTYKTN